MKELHAEKILELEFEYARETAYQAQNDRTVIVNLYLLLVGGVGSLLLAAASFSPTELDLPPQGISVLFLTLGILGMLTLFKLIRLRQAWFDSVREMNRIKDYYFEQFPELQAAFLWKSKTIPALGKAWTITFILSAMVILLSSLSFAVAMHYSKWQSGDTLLRLDAIVFFFVLAIQVLFYFFELRAAPEPQSKTDASK